MKPRAIAILSGGLDSSVSTVLAVERGHRVLGAICFDYGQRAARREWAAARAIAGRLGVPARRIALPWLAAVTRTALVDRSRRLPRPGKRDLDGTKALRTAAAVWVPNRNGVMIHAAAAIAESMGCGLLITGFNREEARTFPDNSTAYLRAVNRALSYSTANGVRVRSFTSTMDKRRIVREALRLGLPIGRLWPCYEGGRRWCRTCESCRRTLRALRAVEIAPELQTPNSKIPTNSQSPTPQQPQERS